MFQPDLFTRNMVGQVTDLAGRIAVDPVSRKRGSGSSAPPLSDGGEMDLPALLERLATVSARPRYTFMVLNLIARAAGSTDRAGPFVQENGQAIPVRDWLSDAMLPMAQRDARRRAVVEQVRLPVPTSVYDKTIGILKSAVQAAKLGAGEKLGAIRRIDAQARALEAAAAGPSFASFVAEERRRSHGFGGRSVYGWEPPAEGGASDRAGRRG